MKVGMASTHASKASRTLADCNGQGVNKQKVGDREEAVEDQVRCCMSSDTARAGYFGLTRKQAQHSRMLSEALPKETNEPSPSDQE